MKKFVQTYGIDVNLADKDGQSPLHVAVMNGRADVISTLLELRANVNAVNGLGETPLHIAVGGDDTGAVSVF